jgi:hypothetical protein
MPLWTIKSTPWPGDNFRVLKPIEVLLEHDVPLTFTFRDEMGRLMLAHFCDSEGDRWRYIAAASNDGIVQRLKSGRESIRDAIDQREMWVVDVGRNERVLNAWAITISRLPDDALPASDVMLYPDLDPAKRSHKSASATPSPEVSPGFPLAA